MISVSNKYMGRMDESHVAFFFTHKLEQKAHANSKIKESAQTFIVSIQYVKSMSNEWYV